MTNAERVMVSRLLDVAAEHFHEHPCNDMDPEIFEDLSPRELKALERGFNAWMRGDTGETCGDQDASYVPYTQIPDDLWMAYMAAVAGRRRDA